TPRRADERRMPQGSAAQKEPLLPGRPTEEQPWVQGQWAQERPTVGRWPLARRRAAAWLEQRWPVEATWAPVQLGQRPAPRALTLQAREQRVRPGRQDGSRAAAAPLRTGA